jgi:hypothetical protein
MDVQTHIGTNIVESLCFSKARALFNNVPVLLHTHLPTHQDLGERCTFPILCNEGDKMLLAHHLRYRIIVTCRATTSATRWGGHWRCGFFFTPGVGDW